MAAERHHWRLLIEAKKMQKMGIHIRFLFLAAQIAVIPCFAKDSAGVTIEEFPLNPTKGVAKKNRNRFSIIPAATDQEISSDQDSLVAPPALTTANSPEQAPALPPRKRSGPPQTQPAQTMVQAGNMPSVSSTLIQPDTPALVKQGSQLSTALGQPAEQLKSNEQPAKAQADSSTQVTQQASSDVPPAASVNANSTNANVAQSVRTSLDRTDTSSLTQSVTAATEQPVQAPISANDDNSLTTKPIATTSLQQASINPNNNAPLPVASPVPSNIGSSQATTSSSSSSSSSNNKQAPSAGPAQNTTAPEQLAEAKKPTKGMRKSGTRKTKNVPPALDTAASAPAPEITVPENLQSALPPRALPAMGDGAKTTEHIPSMADAPTSPGEQEFLQQGVNTTLTQKEEKKEKEESFEKLVKKGSIHLGAFLEPWKGSDPKETVEMNFDNKELTELLKFLSDNLNVTFILDDNIEPVRADGLQPLSGTKISFKSNVPLSLKQAWEIGLTFLEMAGFSVIPSTQPRTYRVTASTSRDKSSANREPLPTFIGTDPELLPDNDSKIRYVYFADNADASTIIQIIDAMKSPSAGPVIEIPQLKAVIMTDKAANIKSLMRILQEIDSAALPETLAIIRLKHTDARQVRELYYKLIGKDSSSPIFNPFARPRKSSTTQYFTEATRVFEEPRTNSLIVLGTRENIKRFEDFIIKYIDKTVDLPFSPLHIIQLKYIDASSIAKILNDTIQKFNSDPANTGAALVGGVRDSNKFFRPAVRITDEPSGNRLIINADYEEYLKLRETIERLDVEQPQVAIKILILNVDLSNTETLGVQLRNKVDCCNGTGGLDTALGTNVNFQTAMVGPIVTNEPNTGATPISGAQRLLGNLINLANSPGGISPFGIGTTLVTLGKDIFGFWGLLRALETYTRVSVVANPFLVATHKYKAEIRVGETRRTVTATVEGQREAQAQGDIAAELRIVITPQISYDDMVTLNTYVELTQFTTTDPTNANRITRKVSTEALLANKEVLALGGLIRDYVSETTYKVPFFGDIPLLGWLFKNKTKYLSRTSLLILIAPEIIKPSEPEVAQAFTFAKLNDAKETLFQMRSPAELRDPIHRWMFDDNKNKEVGKIDKFIATQQRYIDESQKHIGVVA